MVTFFLQTLLVCFAVRSLQGEFKGETNLRLNKATMVHAARTLSPLIALMVCIRTVKIFYACRDLQIQDGCLATTFIHALPVASELLGWLAKWRMVLSCAAVASVPVALVILLQQSVGARHLNPWIHYVGKFGFPFSILCVCGFWLLLCLPQTVLETLPHWQHVSLPRVVYLVCAVAIILCIVSPVRKLKQVLTMNCEANPHSCDDDDDNNACLLYTSPSPRDATLSRMPSSA